MRITAVIDRPLGSAHPRHPELIYPVNYGYVPGIPASDGDWQDAYILGVREPLHAFTGQRIAIIRRRDDVEDKWVLAPPGMSFTAEQIMEAVRFQEQYFDACAELVPDRPPDIRRADEALLEQAVRIRMDCLRAVNCLPRDHAFPDAFIRATRTFLRTAGQVTLLAMDGELPVGCATLCERACIPTLGHPGGKRGHIMNVYTAEGYRRQGIARQLMLALHAEAERRGMTEITLDATDEGRALYAALGYRPSDECMYFDIGRMEQ